MPRKPSRHNRSLTARPVTFSPFSRSVAHIASAGMIKRQLLDSKLPHESSPTSQRNGTDKHGTRESSSESESSEDEEFGGEVQADFAFFDPKPYDFHGVKILLQTYLDDKQWDLSGFVDLILGQTTVGTVVKIEDSDDAGLFSIISALNLGRYKDHKCIIELKDFLLKACSDQKLTSDLKLCLGKEAHNVGLLVSQRVFNLPYQLLPPLYDALFDEVSWATEDEPTEELQKSFCFKSYLLVSKIYKHKNADLGKRQSLQIDEAIIYVKVEDELFHKLSSWSFSFPLQSEPVKAPELKDYRPMGLVMAVEANKIARFREELHALVDEC